MWQLSAFTNGCPGLIVSLNIPNYFLSNNLKIPVWGESEKLCICILFFPKWAGPKFFSLRMAKSEWPKTALIAQKIPNGAEWPRQDVVLNVSAGKFRKKIFWEHPNTEIY